MLAQQENWQTLCQQFRGAGFFAAQPILQSPAAELLMLQSHVL